LKKRNNSQSFHKAFKSKLFDTIMPDVEKSLKTLAKGAGLVFLGMIFSKFLIYIYRIIIARIGPEEYGLLSLGLAFLGFITLFSLFGMQSGTLRFISYYRTTKEKEKLINTLISISIFTGVLSIILSCLGFIFAENIAINIFHNIELSNIIRILMFGAPFIVLSSIFLNVTNAFEKAEYDIISRSLIENIIKVTLTFILIYFGLGVIGATYAYTFAVIVSFIAACFFLKKVIKNYKLKFGNIKQFKKIFQYSWPLLLSSFLSFVYLWTDSFMLGYFKDISIVGIYNVAQPTANFLYMFPYGLMVLFIPVITQYYVNKEEKGFKDIYQSTTKWILMFNSLIFIILLFLGKKLITVFFGPAYISAYIPLIILSIGYFIAYGVHNSYTLFLVYKKTKLVFMITLISSILNIILNLLLIPPLGLIGAAIATGSSYLFIGLIIILFSYKMTKVFPFKISHISIILLAFISGLVINFIIYKIILIESNILSLIITLICMTSLYGIMLILFKIYDKKDKAIIRAIQAKLQINSRKK